MKIYEAKTLTHMARKMLEDQSVSIAVQSFSDVDWHKKMKVFPNFVIYNSPIDFPKKFVVRLFDGTKPTRLITISDTLSAARETIPTDYYICAQRAPEDNPAIVETWI